MRGLAGMDVFAGSFCGGVEDKSAGCMFVDFVIKVRNCIFKCSGVLVYGGPGALYTSLVC